MHSRTSEGLAGIAATGREEQAGAGIVLEATVECMRRVELPVVVDTVRGRLGSRILRALVMRPSLKRKPTRLLLRAIPELFVLLRGADKVGIHML